MCVDNGFETACEVPITISVLERGTGTPLPDVLVELLGSDPLVSGTSDDNGELALTLPVGAPLLLRAHATATYWGATTQHSVLPSDTALGPLFLVDDATATAFVSADGLEPLDSARGAIVALFSGASGAGGERVGIDEACASGSCGPLAFDAQNQPVLSATLIGGGAPNMAFINLTSSAVQVDAEGAPGVNACEVEGGRAQWPLHEKSITFVPIACSEP
jgi:hypothetical protein